MHRGVAGETDTYGCLAIDNLYNIMHTTDRKHLYLLLYNPTNQSSYNIPRQRRSRHSTSQHPQTSLNPQHLLDLLAVPWQRLSVELLIRPIDVPPHSPSGSIQASLERRARNTQFYP